MRPAPACARCCAFTLIELLVVVTIIALLLSILLPSLAAGREAAKSTRCLAGLHNIGQAVTAYHHDNRDWFPLSSHSAVSLASPGAWLQSLAPLGVPREARVCPSDLFAKQKLTSYATNDYLEPLTAGIDFDPITHKTLPGGRSRALTRLTELPSPAATIYVVEPRGEGTIDHIHAVGWATSADIFAALDVERHRGGASYLYCDSHATRVGWPRMRDGYSIESNSFNPETAR